MLQCWIQARSRLLLIYCLVATCVLTACGGDSSSVTTLTFGPSTLPAGTINTPYSQTIQAGGGVAPYTYAVSAGTLPHGLKLTTATGVIAGTPSTDGTYSFTVYTSDARSNVGFQNYSIAISGPLPLSPASLPAGTINAAYSQTINVGGGTAPYSYAVTSGTLPAGLTLGASTGVISGTPTTDGTSSFTVTVTDSAANTGSHDYSVVISGPLPISPSTIPPGTLNTAYSQTISAGGGTAPYTYAVTSGALPTGLTLDTSTGVISGAPATDATYAFTVTATDSVSNTGSQGYSQVISGPLPISPTALSAGTLNTAYSQIISASGGVGPYSYAVSAGALPVGLTLNASSGALSGTPTMDGTASFTVTATDAALNAGSKGYSVVISGPLPMTPATLPAGTVNTAYSQTVTASAGVAPYTYAVTAGALPAGLTLDASTGVLSGTPSTANTYNFTISATDAASNTGSQGYSVVVSGGTSCTVTVTSMLGETNPYSQAIAISYSMVGGGGGAGGGAGSWAAGGGGGSSAILTATSTLVDVASGGSGGNDGNTLFPGTAGAVVAGSFTLPSTTDLTVYVGAGGGGGGWDFGAGGGSGYGGGAGGGALNAGDGAGGGGSAIGGIAASDGGAQNGGSLLGGYGGSNGDGAEGGVGGTGGAASSMWNTGGSGGGYGGGGGSAVNDGTTLPTAGGSNGASAAASGTTPGGVGANTWSSSMTLPVDAGAGGSTSGQGGNAGLVILQYTSPTGTCSL